MNGLSRCRRSKSQVVQTASKTVSASSSMATGYALYNQPCTISSVYIRFLLLLLNAHINVEVCGYIQVVKYLYKYVHKGPDRASVRLLQENVSGQLDEILAYFDARYVCAPGTIHIFMCECEFKSNSLYRLHVYLPDYQFVTFLASQEQETLQLPIETSHRRHGSN
ncbi:hypothetical protein Aduo_018952 [Ancylostoma duodenale]